MASLTRFGQFPHLHGVALDRLVGVFARHSRLGQRQHDPLGMHQAAQVVQVSLHGFRVDQQLLHHASQAVEREIEGVGDLTSSQLGDAAKTSNGALVKLEAIQWQHSYVTKNKTFCIYLAESEERIHEHARLSGFPASKITEVLDIIDPTTEQQCQLATSAN